MTAAGGPARLAAASYAVDPLAADAAAGVRAETRGSVAHLAVDGGRTWSRPLRGASHGVQFVSFQVWAAENTVIRIGGVTLGVTAGPSGGTVQLYRDEPTLAGYQWKELGLHAGLRRFDGKTMAALPVLTVRLDANERTWDLYSGSALVAEDLPLSVPTGRSDRFEITAGAAGAWVAGLVMSDENPFYDDDNANGIDDAFEPSGAADCWRPTRPRSSAPP